MQEEDQPHPARGKEAACTRPYHRQPGNALKEHGHTRNDMCTNRHREEGRRNEREEAKPLPFGCYIDILKDRENCIESWVALRRLSVFTRQPPQLQTGKSLPLALCGAL